MIFSDDNYGRLEGVASILAWVGVGSAAMILIMDGVHLISHGVAGLLSVIRPLITIGVLTLLLPSAVSWTREVSAFVRDDLSAIPKPLMIAIVLLSVALGALGIVAYQVYLLAYVQRLSLPLADMAAHVVAMAVIISIAVAYAGAAAWFAIFPKKRSDRHSRAKRVRAR
jgi:hypothetical protein